MADQNSRPTGRKKTYGTGSSGVHKGEHGLGTGPVGSSNGYAGKTGGSSSSGPSRGSGGGGMLKLIIILFVILVGGGGGLSSLLGGGSSSTTSAPSLTEVPSYTQESTQTAGDTANSGSGSLFSQPAAPAASSQSAAGQQSSGSGQQPSAGSLFGGQPDAASAGYAANPFSIFGNVFSSDWSSQSAGGGLTLNGSGQFTDSQGSQTAAQAAPAQAAPSQQAAPSGQETAAASQAQTGNDAQQESTGIAVTPFQIANNTGRLNTSVAEGSREKYTKILGSRQDKVTIMVYMCGADLESRSGMATRDIQEMAGASLDNVNLLLFTGGASRWNNRVISSQTCQIYKVQGGGLSRLESNLGDMSMTDPNTLLAFLNYGARNFPANRYHLIFWDHGGGSVSGYGHDEKHPRSGSMSLAGINQALQASGLKFDMIGFDTCLMSTLENALMLSSYGDYMVASEETEPGIGWYYTNWLNKLNQNTSMPTVEIGKQIVDDFISTCQTQCRGQKATLAVTDLAELSHTVPKEFADFSGSISGLIKQKDYQTVSRARNGAREFATVSPIDQVDLADLASRIGTKEARSLAQAILGAVKYNSVSSNMTNAYGLSVYFPYKKISLVDSAVKTYKQIGLNDEYAKAIQEFANLEVSGQAAAGGMATGSPLPSLFGDIGGYGDLSSLFGGAYGSAGGGSYSGSSGGSTGGGLTGGYGSSSYGGSGSAYGSSSSSYGSYGTGSADLITQLLGSFLSGGYSQVSGLSSSNTGFLSGRSLSNEEVIDYINDNHLDTSALIWQVDDRGRHILSLTDEEWSRIHSLELNMFYDDGEGFIDLGLDDVFEWDESGNLIGDSDGTWLSVEGQICAYYHLDSIYGDDEYTVTGRIPALLNGERVNLLVTFDNEHEEGYITGATTDYNGDENIQTQAKNMTEIGDGDVIQFICDYYTYDGQYTDSYTLNEPVTVNGDVSELMIRNDPVGGPVRITYRLTDLYNQEYWTTSIAEGY